MPGPRRGALLFMLFLLGLGCADTGGAPHPACTPGATQRCECLLGTAAQSCALDGTHWERCECAMDGGSSRDGGDTGTDDATFAPDVANDRDRTDVATDDLTVEDSPVPDAPPQDSSAVDVRDDTPDVGLTDSATQDSREDTPSSSDVPLDAATVDAHDPSADVGVDAPPSDTSADLGAAIDVRDAATDVGVDAPSEVVLDAVGDAPGDARADVPTDLTQDVRPVDSAAGDAAAGCAPAILGGSGQTTTVTSAFYLTRWPKVVQAGGDVLVLGPFDRWRRWYRGTSSGWAYELIPWPADVINPEVRFAAQLVDRSVAFVYQNGAQFELAVWNGVSWQARRPLATPMVTLLRALTRTPDGTFHFLTMDNATFRFALYSGGSGGFTMTGAPVPPGRLESEVAMTALTNGRLVIAYINYTLYVTSRAPDGTWESATDLTSSWEIQRTSVVLTAARGGGALVGLTGVSRSYRVPYVFASADGVRWDAGDYVNRALTDGVVALDAECIENPVAVIDGGYGVGPSLWRRAAGMWTRIASPPPWPNGTASALVRPSGRAAWAWTENNSAVTSFSVTMSGSSGP